MSQYPFIKQDKATGGECQIEESSRFSGSSGEQASPTQNKLSLLQGSATKVAMSNHHRSLWKFWCQWLPERHVL